jgi:hypothetical protein
VLVEDLGTRRDDRAVLVAANRRRREDTDPVAVLSTMATPTWRSSAKRIDVPAIARKSWP